MSLKTITITSNTTGPMLLSAVSSPDGKQPYGATIMATGAVFGGGTLALFASVDGGVTLQALPNTAGAAVTFTAAGMNNVQLYGIAGGSSGPFLGIYYTFTGGTSQVVKLSISDALA